MQYSFYDSNNKLNKISKMGDVLEQLNRIVNWEVFKKSLDEAIPRSKRSKGGRPPYNNLLMFKILVIKRLFNLSFEQTEFQINDRISFMRFLEMDFMDTVPDANTIWLYEEALSKNDSGKDLFDLFYWEIKKAGYVTHEGSIVDASFIEAPKRKNTKEQREKLKMGETPEEWDDPEHPQRLKQRDTDATWAKKNSESHFGYKDSVKVDLDSKIIVDYEVTTASTADVKAAKEIFDENDKTAYGDSAYTGLELPEGVVNQISEKAQRNKPLNDEQKAENTKKAKKRCRVEHVFAGIVQMAGGTEVRCKNLARAIFNISMLNLIYNMRRILSLTNPTENWVKRVARMSKV